MALTEKNIRNIFIYAAPKFAGYGLNLITLPILTRILTPMILEFSPCMVVSTIAGAFIWFPAAQDITLNIEQK